MIAGHDTVWAGDWPKDPGDREILARACAEDRVLVTLDKDFGELAILHGAAHCGILRLVNIAARQQAGVCRLQLSAGFAPNATIQKDLHEQEPIASGSNRSWATSRRA